MDNVVQLNEKAKAFIDAAFEYFVHSELSFDSSIEISVAFLTARNELRSALFAAQAWQFAREDYEQELQAALHLIPERIVIMLHEAAQHAPSKQAAETREDQSNEC